MGTWAKSREVVMDKSEAQIRIGEFREERL
jgi:transcriptional regulator with XRE-family HTH domain